MVRGTMALCVRSVAIHEREEAGWSQRELAQAAGVHQSLVSRFENGYIADPERVEALLDAYGKLNGRRAGDLWQDALFLYTKANGHPAKLAAQLRDSEARLGALRRERRRERRRLQ